MRIFLQTQQMQSINKTRFEDIVHAGQRLAYFIYAPGGERETSFLTPSELPLQVAVIRRAQGESIKAHVHNHAPRQVLFTSEVLIVRKGRVQVHLYTPEKHYLTTRILEQGDIVILETGGHGFTALEDFEVLEVKQGPYVGESDKTKFEAPMVSFDQV